MVDLLEVLLLLGFQLIALVDEHNTVFADDMIALDLRIVLVDAVDVNMEAYEAAHALLTHQSPELHVAPFDFLRTDHARFFNLLPATDSKLHDACLQQVLLKH